MSDLPARPWRALFRPSRDLRDLWCARDDLERDERSERDGFGEWKRMREQRVEEMGWVGCVASVGGVFGWGWGRTGRLFSVGWVGWIGVALGLHRFVGERERKGWGRLFFLCGRYWLRLSRAGAT